MSMHISLWVQVAHSSLIEGSHMSKNTASGKHVIYCLGSLGIMATNSIDEISCKRQGWAMLLLPFLDRLIAHVNQTLIMLMGILAER